MDRRLTLGIGDNREHCFYVPVGFHLIRLYIDQGFELEELVSQKQKEHPKNNLTFHSFQRLLKDRDTALPLVSAPIYASSLIF